MRKGEILQMKWEDIDLNRKIIYIINAKNNEKREIPMNKALHSTLRKFKKDSDSSYVFTNSDGKPYGDVKAVETLCSEMDTIWSQNQKLENPESSQNLYR